jgi:hypothetical protein
VSLEGQLLRDFADSPDNESEDSGHSESEPQTEHLHHSQIQLLSRLGDLQEVSLVSSSEDIMEFNWPIPHFQNLRKLVLHRLERESWPGNVDDIADTIISSPGLTYLGLSLMPEIGIVNDSLRKLINYYHSNRGRQPLLKLSHLHLGLGFLPVKPGEVFPEDNYFDQLTDLEALKTLCLDNSSLVPEPFDIPDFEIHASLFSKAKSLKKLSVEQFSADIVELIQLLTAPGDRQITLDELEVTRYFETLKTEDDFEDYIPEYGEKRLYSVPLIEGGFHWRKLSYGSKIANAPLDTPKDLLRNFIPQCPGIQELSLPMSQENLQVFKTHIMPQSKKLYTLTIPRGFVADLQIPDSPRPERGPDGKRRKLDNSIQELELGHEARRIDLAKELFETNRKLILQDPEITPLRYVGIGIHVYCCLLSVPSLWQPKVAFSIENRMPNRVDTIQQFQIIKLSAGQAYDFDAVRRLDGETVHFF